jgi:hypothetical protein
VNKVSADWVQSIIEKALAIAKKIWERKSELVDAN